MDPIQGTKGHRSSRRSALGRAFCGAMLLAAAGILLAAVLGAAPANLLFLGLLFFCPVGLWILYRYDLKAIGRFRMRAVSGRAR